MFSKILVANRGEIAVRIIRACRSLGIRTVAVYSEADASALHVKLADEAYSLGPPEASQSYLNMEKILEIAQRSGAEAIHPGYGFLAENPKFAELCEAQGITFIGPSAYSMSKAKPKHRARQLLKTIIPIAPGSDGALRNFDEAIEVASTIGYPVIVKPGGSGGGIGMKVARNREELINALQYAERMGIRYYGLNSLYIEKFFPRAKHIEFQVLADKWGNIIHLGERECSVQRRFQKLIEEAPCPLLSQELRMKIGRMAVEVARALQYVNALTVELLYLPEMGEFYFIEVNCRLQVEHGITELVAGIDIVKEQIKIAAGEKLAYKQEDIRLSGQAIECRINAEDPSRNFLPHPGIITRLSFPNDAGIRIDEGIYEGYEVPFYYDPLLLKLMSWGQDRNEALMRMRKALRELEIEGVKTNIPFHQMVLEDEAFVGGRYTTSLVEESNLSNYPNPKGYFPGS